MNAREYPLGLKLYKRSYQLLSKLQTGLNAIFAGVWLGILDRKVWQMADGIFYDNDPMYQDESYNRSGLWDWEAEIISKYFPSCQQILLAGAGGGREIYALSKQGYKVDGFECNPQFVEYANKFLQQENIDSQVILAPRDCCPQFERVYNGAIIGWGAYTNIQGKQHRIEFLKQMRSYLQPGSPILLSFFPRTTDTNFLKLIAFLGNAIAKIRNLESIEIGDSLFPHRIFVHYFTKIEIQQELEQAGFELDFYDDREYGRAVGIAIENKTNF
jgi:hypothetical protein